MFELLIECPASVSTIAAALPVSRPAVSQHLKVLKEASLVAVRAEGTHRIYELDPVGLNGLRAYLDTFWNRSLAAFEAAAKEES